MAKKTEGNTVKSTVKSAAKKTVKLETPKYAQGGNEEVASDIERAKAAQSRRAQVSASVRSQERRECPRKRLIKQFVGEDALRGPNGEDPVVHAFFIIDTRQGRLRHASDGAMPVLHEGENVRHGSDILMFKPFGYHKEELSFAANESMGRLKSKTPSEIDAESMGGSVSDSKTEIITDVESDEFAEEFNNPDI